MSKQQFNLIVFDWDGTLMDSTSAIVKSLQDSAADLGLPTPDKKKAAHVIGLGLREALETVLPDVSPEYYPKLIERYRTHFLKNSVSLSLFDGVREMLDDLKNQDYFLAVATGKSRAGLNRAIDEVGLQGYFDASRTADETHSKPHPAMLLELTEQLGEPMKRTVMIGDTTHDLLMANNAGASGIAVQYGAHSPKELQLMHPMYSADTVEELHRWLNENA
ncbi:HAD-IA family hydrolase [Oxalobacter formigenes]|uniref:HAD hydrolase, family IA, variant 3 n=1 Tax=Oxalobacter formigenes OXCC13 TaxID=556269 RepID=C3X9I2_OXAFO|nr:HAD-IA family hydrolase [Oxalobacter formigenes]ARQ46013.1 Phosphoglycolate phosphatase [Oxalobacter formigenes]ARQ78215.1 HAD family hydrolase [Oxalobacter formigenes OXCC13]EEO29858.1 HAD hydrolase, family IA, variant 3 [Oxalobacter formigenes OXCC13]MCZ4063631.1 HAD-IA family hydrolase [Oxalobacter formigenes]QDX33240.1 HAD-IA family hydrolase [Oxalobacter formigenes]